ncbi:MAG: hypothetical protein Q9163_000995 [Psora crenata]
MPLIPSTTQEKPSNSETNTENLDNETMIRKIEEATSDVGSSSGGSTTGETKPGVDKKASEAEQAANKLYEERMEDEYAKREGGA